jgi:GTP-binding protein
MLWNELDKETFHEPERIVHKNLDLNELTLSDDDGNYEIPAEEEEEGEEEEEEEDPPVV